MQQLGQEHMLIIIKNFIASFLFLICAHNFSHPFRMKKLAFGSLCITALSLLGAAVAQDGCISGNKKVYCLNNGLREVPQNLMKSVEVSSLTVF